VLNVGTAKAMPEKQLSITASRSRADQIETVGVFCQSVGIIIGSCLDLRYIYIALFSAANTGPSLRLRVVTDGKLGIPIDYFFPN
jgi:hypothetical protein